MAIDSRNKRGSCLSFAKPNLGKIWPDPDGSLANEPDRAQMAYSFAEALTPVVISLFDGLSTTMRTTGVGH